MTMNDNEKLKVLYNANDIKQNNGQLAGSHYDFAAHNNLPFYAVENANNNLLSDKVDVEKLEPKTKQFLLDNPARSKIFNNIASTDRLNRIEKAVNAQKVYSQLAININEVDESFKNFALETLGISSEEIHADNQVRDLIKKSEFELAGNRPPMFKDPLNLRHSENINNLVANKIANAREFGKAVNAKVLMEVLNAKSDDWQHYASVDKPMLQELANSYAEQYGLEKVDISELEKVGASWGSVGKKLADTFRTIDDALMHKSDKLKNADTSNILNNDVSTMEYINEELTNINDATRGSTTGKSITDSIASSTAYMAEFALSAALTGGFGSVAKEVGKQGIKSAVKQTIKKAFTGGLKNLTKGTLNLGKLELARNTLMSPKYLMQAVNEQQNVVINIADAKNIVARVKKTDTTVLESFSNKLISNYVEGFIERSGGLFIGSAFGKTLSKIPVQKIVGKIPKSVKQNIFATFVAKNGTKLANFSKKAQKITAFNGFVAENFEEELSAFSNYLLTQTAEATGLNFLNMNVFSPTVLGNMNEDSLVQLSTIGSSSAFFATLGMPANLSQMRMHKNFASSLELQEQVVDVIHEENIASKAATKEFFEENGLDNIFALDASNTLTLFQDHPEIAKSLNVDETKLAEIENKAQNGDAVIFEYSELAVNLKPEQYKLVAQHIEAINGRVQARKIYNKTKGDNLADTVKNDSKKAKEYVAKEVTNRDSLSKELERVRDELLTAQVPTIDAENTIALLNSYAVTTGYNENYKPHDLIKDLSFQNVTSEQFKNSDNVKKENGQSKKREQLGKGHNALADTKVAPNSSRSNNIAEDSGNVKKDNTTQNHKGAISFLENGKAVISLIENESDFSTIVHEVGHYLHNMFEALANNPHASKQLTVDKTLLDTHLNIDTTNDVERQEKFARSFEQFFIEGKAPSKELSNVFHYAKNLLSNIYQSINVLNRPLNPTVKNVFNRMLATNEQISEAYDNFNIVDFMKKFDLHSLVSNKDRKIYSLLAKNSAQQIAHKITAKREIERNKAVKRHRKAANEIIVNSYGYKVYNKIRSMGRLNANEVREAFGETTLKNLAKLGLIRFRSTPQKRVKNTLSDNDLDVQTSRNRTAGNKAREEKFNQFLLDNYTILWAMNENGIKSVRPDKSLMIGRDSFGSYLNNKHGFTNDLAAAQISETLGYEVTTEELGYFLQDLKKGEIRKEFYSEQQALEDYYNKMQLTADVEQLSTNLYTIAEANNFSDLESMIKTVEKMAKPSVFVQDYIAKKMSEFDDNFDAEEAVIKAKNKASEYELLERALATKSNNEQNIQNKRSFNTAVKASLDEMTIASLMSTHGTFALIHKNRQELESATAKKDFDSAFNSAKKLRFNVEKLRHQEKRIKTIEKTLVRNKKRLQGKLKNIQGDWAYNYVDLAYRFGLTSKNRVVKSEKNINDLLEDFALENENAISFDLAIINASKASNFKKLTSRDFNELAMLLDFTFSEGKTQYFNALKSERNSLIFKQSELTTSLDKHFADRLDNRTDSALKHVKHWGSTYLNSVKTFHTLIEELDNFAYTANDSNSGVFREHLYQPVLEAEHNALIKKQTVETQLKGVNSYLTNRFRSFDKNILQQLPEFNEDVQYNSRTEWDFMNLFTFALNCGNVDNYSKLQEGYGFNDSQMTQIMSSLNSEDWNMVQKVWDTLDSHIAKDLNATYKKLNHVNLKMVEADEFSVNSSDGENITLKGGYYPLNYDLNINSDIKEKEDIRQQINAHKTFLNHPTNGMLKDRKNSVNRAVSLEYSKLSEYLFESIHYITFEPKVKEISKLLKTAELRNSIEHKKGKEFFRALNKIVNNIRIPSSSGHLLNAKFFEVSRALAVTKALWGNLGAAMMQLSSFSSGMTNVGASSYVSSLTDFIKNPRAAIHEVHDLSPFMRDRFNNVDIDLKNNLANIKDNNFKRGLKHSRNAGFYAIKVMDGAVAVPMWRAAYYKKMREHGNKNQAVIYADNLIASTQGSSQLKDISVAQMNPIVRFFTMFTSATQALGNRLYTYGGATKKGQLKANQISSFVLLEVLTQMLAQGAIRCLANGQIDLGDDETQKMFASESLGYFFQGLPGVRDAVSYSTARAIGENAYYRGISSPAFEIPTYAIKTLNDIFQKDSTKEKRFTAITEGLGLGVNPMRIIKQIKKIDTNINKKTNNNQIELNLR